MTMRIYLMPLSGAGTYKDPRLPKYSTSFNSGWSMLPYGPEPYCIVASDTNNTVHTNITANSDVRAFPDDLDSTLTGGARTQIVNTLEAGSVPAQWVTTGMTYRTVLRRLSGIFQMLQNVNGRGFRFLQAALDDPLSSLPLNVRTAMQAAATTLNLDTSGITLSQTLRTVLGNFGNQFASRPLLLRNTSF